MTRGFNQLAAELRSAEERRAAGARRPDRARGLLDRAGHARVALRTGARRPLHVFA